MMTVAKTFLSADYGDGVEVHVKASMIDVHIAPDGTPQIAASHLAQLLYQQAEYLHHVPAMSRA